MLLSILIPVYNAERFIERCIASIINQAEGLDNIELVVINDGSTDSSPEILKNLAEKHSIISLYEQQNSGEGFTRNVGLDKAKGDYIWFIDADDYIDGEILKEVYTTLQDKKPEAILFGYKTVDLEGVKVSEVRYPKNELTRDELINQMLFSNTVWSKVINRDLIHSNNIRFDPAVKTATDFDFSFRALYFSKKIIVLDNINYNYVVNPDSISNIRTKEHLERLAKDSVTVGCNIHSFLTKNETNNPGSKQVFKLWLDNYLYGLLFSLYRFEYDIQFIDQILASLKQDNNYPVSTRKMNTKKKLFMGMANRRKVFLSACKMNRK